MLPSLKILSVDVARFGDDQTVLRMLQGRKSTILAKFRGLDNVQVGERVIEFLEKERPMRLWLTVMGLGLG